MKTPVTDIWIAINKVTKEHAFIEYGQRYDQKMFDLITPVTADEVFDLILKQNLTEVRA
uniref:Uncharacterized protein n=1 Tax=Salmonella phage PMBT22 TaxID=3153513 RepID=A0AAU8GJA6_9CAUD